jgi:hypothetical protein
VTPSKNCPSELRFGSLLVYSPQGKSDLSNRSRQVVRHIKNCRKDHIARVGERFAELAAAGRFGELLGSDVVLVPTPRRSPPVPDMLWPALEISRELERRGLCASVQPLLERHRPVPKSALQTRGSERPSPDAHHTSMRCLDTLQTEPSRITIVDDIVTRGSTMLGCAWTLATRFPDVAISALAVVRTMSGSEITEILAPVDDGNIHMQRGAPRREP